MPAIDVSERALHAWEQGSGKSPAERVAIILENFLAFDQDALNLALYQRDALLVDLYISLRGRRLDAVIGCPGCATEFDLPLDLYEMRRQIPQTETVWVEDAGFVAAVRPPSSTDLVGLPEAGDSAAVAAELFLRCVEQATHQGRPIAPELLPPAIRDIAASRLSEKGMEGLNAEIACAVCGETWSAPLDIGRAMLREVDGWARHLLDDVHRIASAYHWSEHEILSLPAPRRRYYLEAIG